MERGEYPNEQMLTCLDYHPPQLIFENPETLAVREQSDCGRFRGYKGVS